MQAPLISICIPAYKRVNYLKRLLDSIAQQKFRDFEVIITDDSDDTSVEDLSQLYKEKFTLLYHKNMSTLGTPANWNAGVSLAKGEWIKLIHDDDWFVDENSLSKFASVTDSSVKFIFSAYQNIYESVLSPKKIGISSEWKNRIASNPETIFALNVIGPPSVTLIHKSITLEYDERLKWRVDQEFYIRLLKMDNNFIYIPETLINIGISSSQVTQRTMYNPTVELPEGLIMLQEHGILSLKNIRIYDTWWRLFRNMGIVTEDLLYKYSRKEWPLIILRMMKDLSKVPSGLLKNGVISKTFMTLSFLKNRSLADENYNNKSL